MDDWEFRVNDTDALLVVLDSVRASNLGLYTHINEATPFLETFGEQATVYTEVRAPSIGFSAEPRESVYWPPRS